jgi:hypothetical protein
MNPRDLDPWSHRAGSAGPDPAGHERRSRREGVRGEGLPSPR